MPSSAKPRLLLNRPCCPQAALTLLLLATGLFVATPAAQAATLTVSSTADDGSAGTLRSQIAAAKSGDTINFSVTGTIQLAHGRGVLEINKPLTIQGPGSSNLTISGENNIQVFLIDSGASVTISGLYIGFGYSYFNGGGVENNGTLTIADCTVMNNMAEGAYAGGGTDIYGGGIYSSGPLTLTGCAIQSNTAHGVEGTNSYDGGAAYGGGVYCSGKLTMSNCTVENNFAIAGSTAGSTADPGTAYGGGVDNDGASSVVSGSVFSGNSAIGGNSSTYDGPGNVTMPGAGIGGGVENNNQLTVTNSSFLGNSTEGGYVGDSDNGGTDEVHYAGAAYGAAADGSTSGLTFQQCTFDANEAEAGFVESSDSEYGETYYYYDGLSYGGALSGAPLSLTNCVLTHNTAVEGGAVDCDGSATLVNCTVTSNTAAANSAAPKTIIPTGGGVDAETGTITNDLLWNNTDPTTGASSGSTDNLVLSSSSGSKVQYSDVPTGNSGSAVYDGTGNIAADPLFVRNIGANGSSDPGDLHLQAASPAAARGTHTGAPATAIDGQTRHNPPSMGAYEAVAYLSSVTLGATSATGGATISGSKISFTADVSADTKVTLTSSNKAVASVPSSETIASGDSSHGFTITTSAVTTPTTVTITATLNGESKSATITVNPPPTALKSVVLSPASVQGGSAATTANRVYWTGNAPASEVVTLKSSNTAVAAVPSSVTISSGSSSHAFTITTKAVTSTQTVTITATSGGVSQTATLTVTR